MKRIFLLLGLGILITAGILFSTSSSRAFVLPSVYVQDLTLNKTDFQSGDTITGSFKIYSAATAVVPGIKYKFQILGGIVNDVPTVTYYEETGANVFVVSPFQTITKNFSHQLPKGLTGDYLLRIALVNEQGLSLGWDDQNISIKGSSAFISLSETYFIIGGQKVDAGLGPTFNSDQIPKIQFKAKNDSGASFSLTPRIDIYQRTVETANLVKSYQENIINFTANSEQIINLDLPKLNTPQVYVASIKLFDGDKLASNIINFRWVIAGGGANIWQTNTDKTSYKVGEQAKVNIICAGSADTMTELGKGTMEINLYSQSGELVGKTSKEIDLDKCSSISALVGIIKDVDSPIVKTEIIKDGSVITSNQVSLEGEKEVKASVKPPIKIPYLWLIAIGVAIAALILILRKLLIKKSFPNTPIPPISILLIPIIALTFFMGINNAKADVKVVEQSYNYVIPSHNFEVGLTYNQPTHNSAYRVGNKIQFSGKVSAAWCVNSLAKAYVDFYLTDANGANTVKLNSERIFIGSIPGTGAEIPGTGAEVEYNFSLTIPAGISFFGPARAYIDYIADFYHFDDLNGDGVLEQRFWGTGWIIAYEHILITPLNVPYVDLKVNNQDAPSSIPLVIEAPDTYTLSWESWNSNQCTATSSAGDWGGVKSTAGSDALNTSSTNIYTYTIICTGPSGPPSTDSVYVKVNADPWVDLKVRNLKSSSTDYFDAATASAALLLEEPADYELVWNSRRSSQCIATSSWSGVKSATGTQDFASITSGIYEYGIICSRPGAPTSTDQVFVKVFGEPKVDLKINGQDVPPPVAKNEVYALSWQTWNVNSCAASGAWSGNKSVPTGTSTSSQASVGNYKYELICSGGLGNATDTVNVQVKALPNCSFLADPQRVMKNNTSTLNWDCHDVTSCSIDQGIGDIYNDGLGNINSSTTTSPLAKTTIFTLTCFNGLDMGNWKAVIGIFGEPNWWEIKP